MANRVAVLIPTLNEGRTLGRLLKSLNDNSYSDKEIVIIDGGSKDETVRIAKNAGATVLIETGEKKDRCPANAWNQGAKHIKAEVLCFLDADSVSVNRDFLKKSMDAFDDRTSAIYAGYRTSQDTKIEKIISVKEGVSIHPTFVRKDVFEAVGGYPLIGYGEDTIFAKNTKEYSVKNGLIEKRVPESYWVGNAVQSVGELYRQKKWYGRTSLVYAKHLKGKGMLRGIIGVYTLPVYFLSFLALPFVLFHWLFLIPTLPFLIVFFGTIGKNRGWRRAKVILNLVSGLAMIHGIFSYVFSANARMGR